MIQGYYLLQYKAKSSKGRQNYWRNVMLSRKIKRPNGTKGRSFTETLTNHGQKT